VFLITFVGVRVHAMRAAKRGVDLAQEAAPLAPTPATYAMPFDAGALWRGRLLLAFRTAGGSFIYPISWITMLCLVVSGATPSFELMLSAFILGLALGSLWVHRRADRFSDPVRTLGAVQWLMGACAMGTIPLYLWSFRWTQVLVTSLTTTDGAYMIFGLARYA